MSNGGDEFTKMVADVGYAVQVAQPRLEKHSLHVESVEMEIACTFKKTVDGKITFGPAEAGAVWENSNIHTFTVSLAVPELKLKGIESGPAIVDELMDAILVASTATRAAATHLPTMQMKSTVVALQVVREKSGSLKLAVGGGLSKNVTHAVKLTLAPT